MVPPKPVGFISVSIGEGIGEIFRELGVDYLIEGGQTMNPSTRRYAACNRRSKCGDDLHSSE